MKDLKNKREKIQVPILSYQGNKDEEFDIKKMKVVGIETLKAIEERKNNKENRQLSRNSQNYGDLL